MKLKYQDFKNTIHRRSTVAAKVVLDVLPAGAHFVVTFGCSFGEFDGIGRKDDVCSESTAGFYIARDARNIRPYPFGRTCNGRLPGWLAYMNR